MTITGYVVLVEGGDRPYFFSYPPVEFIAANRKSARVFEFTLPLPPDVSVDIIPINHPSVRPWTPPEPPKPSSSSSEDKST